MKPYAQRLADLGHCAALDETYYAATERRHRQHVAACRHQNCEDLIVSFEVFAREVIEAVTDAVRVSILRQEPMAERKDPFQQLPQYVSPKDDKISFTAPKPTRGGRLRQSATPWRSLTLKRSVSR